MIIDMNDDNVMSIAQLREFLKLSQNATFTSKDVDEAYAWIGRTLGKFRYTRLQKKDKHIVKEYLMSMTGYSETQIDRLIARKKKVGRIVKPKRTQPTFPRVYTTEDLALLIEVDNAECRRTGGALKKTLADMFLVYGDKRFERLAHISVSHIYNLRGTRVYESGSLQYTKTNPTPVNIGIRTKPQPEGKPGYIRVDSVHQGDLDKRKGVYHINMVDEVTQTEVVSTVEGISEMFLIPALHIALAQFPFRILSFHSDNGSEYINKYTAKLLNTLMIEQTKSRARHCNDNSHVEGKNNFVVRKHFGYTHIPKKYAQVINEFNRTRLNPYLFYHRQCAFAEEQVDERGKIKKVYKDYRTPCEKLLSLEGVDEYLKEGVTVESLKKNMMTQTHLVAAQEMQAAKQKLFAQFRHA